MDSASGAVATRESDLPDESLLAEGTVVAGVYRVESVLGSGGMGAVYKVAHVHMRKAFALKVLHHDMSSMPEIVARFEREAVAAGSIQHPNVVAATDFGRLDDGSFYLVLEYVAGSSLRDRIAEGPMDPMRALRIARGITVAVGAAHAKGIVHRDLKPENVMLVDRDGNPDFVKVLDFGIAKLDQPAASGAQPLTRMGAVFGTPDYMAPEQAMGEAVDARADLYAVGVLLFEMLTGTRPFGGGTVTVMRKHVVGEVPELPPEIAAGSDPRVAAIVQRLLQKDKNARFANAGDLVLAFDEIAEPTPSIPPASLSRPSVTSDARASASSPSRPSHPIGFLPTVVASKPVERPEGTAALFTAPRVAAAVAVLGLLTMIPVLAVCTLGRSSGPPAPFEVEPRGSAEITAAGVESAKPPFSSAPPAGAPGGDPAPAKRSGGGGGGRWYDPRTW
jgi:serine/threonine protein kinase